MASLKTSVGPGRLIIAIYAIFALSAFARSSYQLITKLNDAPVSYSLSLVAAIVYIIATVALARNYFKLAAVTLVFELVGVLTVGSLSFLMPSDFSHSSVWSGFGAGYLWVPLILPLVGLWWLRKRSDA